MWYQKTKAEVAQQLQTDVELGLTEEEAQRRLLHYGPNKLAEKAPRTLLQRFWTQINDVLIYVLLAAALVSAVVGEASDAVIILLVVILNAGIGMVQESKAEHALEALKQLTEIKAIVKRNGEWKLVNASEIVPGDLVKIDAGSYIPSDLYLIETASLKIDESALTGESVPVDKHSDDFLAKAQADGAEPLPLGDQANMAFMSTLATLGRGVGIAVETGMNTQIGRIATMFHEEEDQNTPLQKNLARLGQYMAFAAIGICVLMFLIGMFQGRSLFTLFFTAISLAVAAIPEGLPAIVSIVLAIGVQKMIKQNVIIRRLPAVEALGSVNIICSDKTGTLTQNKMTVTHFFAEETGAVEDLREANPLHKLLMENLVLCNDATFSPDAQTGDPTEIALLEAGARIKLDKAALEQRYPRVGEIPFDSVRKRMTTCHRQDDGLVIMTKGALEGILPLCTAVRTQAGIEPLTPERKQKILAAAQRMSQQALRVLAAAYRRPATPVFVEQEAETDLIFIGMVGMIDPPRQEVKHSIELCKQAGIRTVMITGDHRDTAFAIARQLGIAETLEQTMTGTQLEQLSEAELHEQIDNLRVFARVSPEHKVKLVAALKAKGYQVSMTGDGVNDAPSLKRADIGVAMGITGTDVAKGAADMILTDDNFASIVKAVEEGRNIFQNIKKSVVYLLSCNLGEIIALFLAILFGWATPLRPTHILWVNLITDTLPAIALGMDPGNREVMKKRPRSPKDHLLKDSWGTLAVNGGVIGLVTLTAFLIGIHLHNGNTPWLPLMPEAVSEEALVYAQTMAFLVLSFSQLVHAFNLRDERLSVFQIGIFANKLLLLSAGLGVLLQLVLISVPVLADMFRVVPLAAEDWIPVIVLSFFPLFINEMVKLARRLRKE